MKVEVTIKGSDVLVKLERQLANATELHRALGKRLEIELRDHFNTKNNKPNKLGGQRENFWAGVAKATLLKSADKNGATVVIGKREFNVHAYGGPIKPLHAKALTIPLVPEAKGMRAETYERTYNVKLFRIKGRDILFAKSTRNLGASESLFRSTRGNHRTGSTMYAARVAIRAVYALKKSVTIPRDPDALPNEVKIREAFTEVVDDYFSEQI